VDAPRIGGEQCIGCGCRIGLAQPGLPKHLPAKYRQLVLRYVYRVSSIGSGGIWGYGAPRVNPQQTEFIGQCDMSGKEINGQG
jgi:hypothetical protein